MRNMQISHQKATAIIRKEGLGKLPKPNESLLLRTGAKLVNRDSEYWISGYAHDGSDVTPTHRR